MRWAGLKKHIGLPLTPLTVTRGRGLLWGEGSYLDLFGAHPWGVSDMVLTSPFCAISALPESKSAQQALTTACGQKFSIGAIIEPIIEKAGKPLPAHNPAMQGFTTRRAAWLRIAYHIQAAHAKAVGGFLYCIRKQDRITRRNFSLGHKSRLAW